MADRDTKVIEQTHTTMPSVVKASAKSEALTPTTFTGQQDSRHEQTRYSLVRRRGAWRDALLRRMLALADLGAALLGGAAILVVDDGTLSQALWAALFAPIWLVIAKVVGLYDRDQRSLRHLTVDELPRILTWALMGAASVALLLELTPAGELSGANAIGVGATAVCGGLILRTLARFVYRRVTPPEEVIIVGGGTLAAATKRKLELFPDMHLAVVGELSELSLDDLHSLWSRNGADRVIVALPQVHDTAISELVPFCRTRQLKLSIVPPARAMFGTAVELSHVADLPVLEYNTWDVSRSTMLLKRILDLAVAAVVLAALAPVALLIVIAILLDSGRPVLFTQVRVGQGGRTFRMLKFRTMVPNAEELLGELVPFEKLREPMFKLPRDPRVTFVGRFLRRTSLDELPQLLNVLKGDMSLVGPRPEQCELVERYQDDHLFRLVVKPGLTGPMQVYGRGQLTFEERLAVEREYVENISVGRDLHILALTVGSVLNGRGAF